MKKQLKQQASFFSALADPVRLAIVEKLIEQDKCLCVCDLAPVMERDQSVIYRHLVVLNEAGIVTLKKRGKYLMCCVPAKQRVELLFRLQGDIMEQKETKKSIISKFMDGMDEKLEKKSKKECCGKGGCCK